MKKKTTDSTMELKLKTINTIAIKDIQAKNVSGNMLYKDNKNYYFAPNFCNCIIINNFDENKVELAKYGIGRYLLEQLSVFAKVENRPSLIFKSIYPGYKGDALLETLGANYQKLEYVSDMPKFNKSSSYYVCANHNYFMQIIDELYKSRNSGHYGMTPVYIIIEDLINIDLSFLTAMITLSKSRDIHFIVIVNSNDDYEAIVPYFDLQITCDNYELKKIVEVVDGTPILVKQF